MAVVVIVTGTDYVLNEFIVYGTLTLSGNYGGGSTHGDVISFAGIDLVKSQSIPNIMMVFEAPAAGNAATGYVFIYAPGTTRDNGQLIVMQCGGSGSPFAEITQGSAYPGALTATSPSPNISFRAAFPFGV